MIKAKLGPMKPPTLPQLELTAARLEFFILSEITVSKLTMRSDSQVELHWLNCKKTLKSYVTQ